MFQLEVRNVCGALNSGVEIITRMGQREKSRNGPVLVLPAPLITTTHRPTERVLFSPVRDANPFFHLYEAIWMLAGRDDVKPLQTFVRDFEKYADDGRIHGAYGRRWRSHFGFDQLNLVVKRLRINPHDRQCVLTMWDPCPESIAVMDGEVDIHGANDLRGDWRDRPCNTHVYLRVRTTPVSEPSAADYIDANRQRFLDITVCCRSNDMLLGGWGANTVHFSILQEYLAARIGCSVGVMYQVSNNAHIYESGLEMLKRRGWPLDTELRDDRYIDGKVKAQPMFEVPDYIDDDIKTFMTEYDDDNFTSYSFTNSWFPRTLTPAMIAHALHRKGDKHAARNVAQEIDAPDWRVACTEWLDRREIK